MNIIGNVMLFFGLFPSFGHHGAVVQDKPPPAQTAVWGYALPQYDNAIRNVHPRLFRRDNGEVLITYLTEPIQTLKADNTCCDDDFLRQGIEFFSGKTQAFTPVEYEEFYRDVGTTLYTRTKKIQLGDGATVEVVSKEYNCYQFVNASLVKKDRGGRVLASKVLFYKYATTKRMLVDETCGTRAPRAGIDVELENIDPSLVKLDDNNFLIYEPANGNLVVRFDASLHTQFHSDNLLVMDQGEIDTIHKQLLLNQHYSEQAFHNSIVNEVVHVPTRLSQSRAW